jgi:transcriptional regulator with XRE-family HTH domain
MMFSKASEWSMMISLGGFMKTQTRKLLGARIKELRINQHISQAQLAEQVDIDSKSLSRIEVGGSDPSLDTLENIAVVLGVEVKDFFEFTHNVDGQQVKESIRKLLASADEKQLKVILKVVRAIVR